MKKYLNILFICALAIFIGGSVAFAQTTNSNPKNTPPNLTPAQKEMMKVALEKAKAEAKLMKEQGKFGFEQQREVAKQKIENLKVQIKTEKDTAKAKIAETRIASREQALQKFDVAIEKFNTSKEKIKAKIEQLKSNGITGVAANNQIAVADGRIIEARAKIAEINTLLVESTNELSTENRTKIKQLSQDIQDIIRNAYQILGEATTALRTEVQNKLSTTKAIPPTEETKQ